MSDRQEIFQRLAREPGRYDSHLPVLWALGATIPVRTVVEFGPGFGSTPTWLDRACFPALQHLISYEDDLAWYQRFQSEEMPATVRSDARWELKMVQRGNLCFEAPWPADTDLVFVDSAWADGRVAVVMTVRGEVPLVVLHDYDGPAAYRKVAALWPYRILYDRLIPNTIVLSATPIPTTLTDALHQWQT